MSRLESILTRVNVGDEVTRYQTTPVALPVGTVTLLMADAEGSTQLWESEPDAMAPATNGHDRIVNEATGRHGGVKPKDQGEGDSFMAAFSRPSDALEAAVEIQSQLLQANSPLKLRMAIHTGEVQLRDESNYIGIAVNRTARLRSIGHGGQILVSQVTHDLVADHPPSRVSFKALGTHRLKDLARPEQVFQVMHADLSYDFPPLRSLDALPNNLPAQRTAFIGRTKELAETRGLLSGTRLLTLSGTGGSGKTRLAIQLAAELLDDFEDGVWLVSLASVDVDDGVNPQVAAVLGLGTAQSNLVPTFIGSKVMLLVLDNAEHVLDTTSAMVSELLDTCPALRIVTTSREALNIAGETVYRVPSLSLPADGSRLSIGSLGEFEAIQLFVERAIHAYPNFKIGSGNAETVSSICQRLDGIPLAIELAAARVRMLSPQQILDGLSDRFRLLTGSARATMPRQQTLRASVDWSHDLLDEDERKCFRRLGFFPASFDLEAGEVVASSEGLTNLQVFDVMTRLVDKSLVSVLDGERTSRYTMLETVRHYALERLEDSGEIEEVRLRHRDHYLSLTEAEYESFFSSKEEPSSEHQRMSHIDDWTNAEAALEGALEGGEGSAAARFLANLSFAHSMGREWVKPYFERTLAVAPEGSIERARVYAGASDVSWAYPELVRYASEATELLSAFPEEQTGKYLAQVLLSQGVYASWVRGDQRQARSLIERAIEISTRAGNQYGDIFGQVCLGLVRALDGDVDEGLPLARDAVARARQTNNEILLSACLFQAGCAHSRTGHSEAGLVFYEEAVPLLRNGPFKFVLQWTLALAASTLMDDLDRLQDARDYAEEGLRVSRDYRLLNQIYWGLLQMWAVIAEKNELFDEARATFGDLVDRVRSSPTSHATALGSFAAFEFRCGGEALAHQMIREALLIARQHADESPAVVLAPMLESVTIALDARPVRAARLAGFLESWIQRNAVPTTRRYKRRFEERVGDLVKKLGEPRARAELALGGSMDATDAVSYALEDEDTEIAKALMSADAVEDSLRHGTLPADEALDEQLSALESHEASLARAVLSVGVARKLVADDVMRAESLLVSALPTLADVHDPLVVAAAFDLLADAAAIQQSYEESARLCGAARALKESAGLPSMNCRMGPVKEALGDEVFESAIAQGMNMGLKEAVEYATRGRGKRKRPSSGWKSLTPTESRLAELVAEGLTNPQIAEQLFVSRRTVQTHLYNIFAKVGVNTRTELAAEMVRRKPTARAKGDS